MNLIKPTIHTLGYENSLMIFAILGWFTYSAVQSINIATGG